MTDFVQRRQRLEDGAAKISGVRLVNFDMNQLFASIL
jgi:hypothetical protein